MRAIWNSEITAFSIFCICNINRIHAERLDEPSRKSVRCWKTKGLRL
jgi:hypothetical protein